MLSTYQHTVTVRKKFDTIHETSEKHTLNNKYENFVATNKEAAAECIPTKPRAECRVPLESIEVREKPDNMKKAS